MNREDIVEDHVIPLTAEVQDSIRRLHTAIDLIKMRDAIDEAQRARLTDRHARS